MMKTFLFILVGIAGVACAHQAPPPSQEPSLDDAAIRKYQHADGDNDVGGLRQTVTLGKGEVDLSKWKSSEERAAEASAAEVSGAPAETSTASSSPTDAMQSDGGAEMSIDADGVGRVEADDVRLVPPDE